VGPALAAGHAVVACDLKGCAASRAPDGGTLGEGYAAREIAAELVELMARVGHGRFAVAGHDRGARIAYRMALDHPDVVTRVAVLNVIPTVEQFERLSPETAVAYLPWILLAQPPPFAERLLEPSADWYVRTTIASWLGRPGAIDAPALDHYAAVFTPATIAAWCAEYRAAIHLDRPLDAADRAAGRTIACPVLVHWGAEEAALADALEVWRRWADDVRGGPLPGGHFVPEEAPDELTASLRAFLAR
jgi:haloacetate dehalogenase